MLTELRNDDPSLIKVKGFVEMPGALVAWLRDELRKKRHREQQGEIGTDVERVYGLT